MHDLASLDLSGLTGATIAFAEIPCADLNPDALIDSFAELTKAAARLLAPQ